MRSDSTRLARTCPDASRQPPTRVRHPTLLAAHNGSLPFVLTGRGISPGLPSQRHKAFARVVRALPGKASGGTPRPGFSESEDSEPRQSADVSWWQEEDQQAEEAEIQQQRQQHISQLSRRSSLPRPPRLTPFSRTQDQDYTSPTSTAIAAAGLSPDSLLARSSSFNGAGADANSMSARMLVSPPSPQPPNSPAAAASPQSRAFGVLSTAISVLAVGAYVYNLVRRRQTRDAASGDAGGPMVQKAQAAMPGVAPAGGGLTTLPPTATKRPGAGSGLFRPANAPPAPARPAAIAAAAAAAPAVAPPAAVLATNAADVGAAATPRPAAAVAGPEQPPTSPARESGWWRRLGRVYYISFGAQYGLVPRIRLDGTAGTLAGSSSSSSRGKGGSSSAALVAFEDPADAEYVANALWEDLVQSGTQPPGPRPPGLGVLSAAPIFMEDLAAMRGAPVEVVPSDGLRKDVQLNGSQLEVVLAALVRGLSPEAAAAQAQRVVYEAAAAAVAAAEAAPGGGATATAGAAVSSSSSTAGSVPSSGVATVTSVRKGAFPARTAELQGLKVKLPSKFDFPGFDAEKGQQREAATTPAPQQATALSADMAAASPATAAAVSQTAALPPLSTVVALPRKGTPPSAPAPLPQVVPSAVREPGRGEGDGADDEYSSRSWGPYNRRVIDAEAVEVSTPSTTPPSALSQGLSTSSAPTTGPGATAASDVNANEVDEAMREYRELENLLAMAVGGGGTTAELRSNPSGDRSSTSRAAASAGSGSLPAQHCQDGGQEPSLLRSLQQQQQQQQQQQGQEVHVSFAGLEASAEELLRPQQQLHDQQQQWKSGAEMAQAILKRQGPTDAAIEAALVALEAEVEGADDELLDEYYSIFNKGSSSSNGGISSSSSEISGRSVEGSGPAAPSSSSSPASSPAASRTGGGSDLAAEMAEVQQQLAGVVKSVAAAHARGVPPPADAAATMQRLQRQLQDLQARLAAAPAVAAPAPAPQASAATRRHAGGLFSQPPSPHRPTSSSSSSANGSGVSISSSNGVGSSGSAAPSDQAAAEPAAKDSTRMADPASLVTPLNSIGSSAAGGGSTTLADGSSSSSKAGARRAWGAWKANRRIQEAEATFLKSATPAATLPPPAARQSPPPSPPVAAPAAGHERAPAVPTGPGGGSVAEDAVMVVSKRVGSNRPPKVVEAPEARQDRVKEALRVFSEMGSGTGDEEGEGEEGGETDEQLFGRSASLLAGGRRPWWQQRFQALFLPTIGYPDGSMGFLQVNVSLSGDRRDMRVLAFEDRTDCTACLTLMAQWPEYEGTEPRMSMMPTDRLLQQLQDIYDSQSDDLNSGVSRPRGLAVFRRGKLPMRPGMGPEEFIQVVVYQHAAQMALARTGYGFNA